MTTTIDTVRAQWPILEPIFLIRNEREYDAAVARLNDLLDEVGTDENHPLYGLLDTLGTLIEAYEAEYEPLPPVSGADMLQYLMEEHGLRQADLSEIGSQGVVSEILSGKRELNVRQIRALAERFEVSPAVFV
ncbi:Transcriptional regulator [Candidatus Promineifilum breve]|uniref:Transcriptional regulator n=1 Tax=Candidatus Promineifilum breve TaxID=1806508 RepID=A0A160T0N1_9CHLR|nr:helix-turn-helix domain-containing protein [Candidatus Promineifilum breve]CUS03501.2 Transcriptional regulator [Candidatus Promineifilum breve]